MVNYDAETLNATFAALADPTRRAILDRLVHGERTVSELAEPFPISLPAITKHLAVLRRAGLIEQHKDGRVRRCSLQAAPLRHASRWIARYRDFWEQRLDGLAAYLEEGDR